MNQKAFFALVPCCFILAFCGVLAAQNDQSVTLITPSIEFLFQPPARISASSKHRLDIEMPRVNMAVNLAENYLQYLLCLKKIKKGTRLKFVYAPDSDNAGAETFGSDVIAISELGLNGILTKINEVLKNRETTDKDSLLDGAATLFSISDKYQRLSSKIADKINLKNLSSSPRSLEPDSEFALTNKECAVVTRPYLTNNRLFKITQNSEGEYQTEQLLGQAKEWYENLTPSKVGNYLAFTDGAKPMVLFNGMARAIFGNKDVILLKMAWSPTEPYLAGMVIVSETQNRLFFVYDAKENKLIDCGDDEIKKESDYFNALPYWSDDGKKIILTSCSAVHLIYPHERRAVINALRLNGEIAELMWASNSKAFALVEIEGQARNRYKFDDLDFRQSVLRSFSIDEKGIITEDQAQKTISRNTIKLVGFYNDEQILYLEGHLMSKRLPSPVWQLHHDFRAYLTPKRAAATARGSVPPEICVTKIRIPINYLFVYKNIDSKYQNIYDSGFKHSNYAHVKDFNNVWVIGLKKPIKMPHQNASFNYRRLPYPFLEKNICVFSGAPFDKIKQFMKFLEEYEIRSFVFNQDTSKLYMLANFEGPLNLFCADKQEIFEKLDSK